PGQSGDERRHVVVVEGGVDLHTPRGPGQPRGVGRGDAPPRRGHEVLLDRRVGGRDDLRARGAVHLDAVVPGGVVGGGDHEARDRAACPDGGGEDRGGDGRPGGDDDETVRGEHPAGPPDEALRAVAGVAGHHDERPRGLVLAQVAGHGGGHERDGALVHPGRPGPQRRADTGGTEMQGHRPSVPPGQARATAGSTARRASVSPAAPAEPAARTSAWSSGSPVTPAARLVTREAASTSSPSPRAATTSGTVDIPTRSAPSVRSMRISAGVSYWGPGIAAYTPSAGREPVAATRASAAAERSRGE